MKELIKELLKEVIGKEINLFIIPEIGKYEFKLTGTLTKHIGNNPLYKVTCKFNENNYHIFSENSIYEIEKLFGDVDIILLRGFNYTDEMRKMVTI